MAVVEQRRDTVAIPRSAVRFAAGLATAALIGISSVIYSLNNAFVRTNERMDRFQNFMDKGDRCNSDRCSSSETRISILEKESREHNLRAERLIGQWTQTLQSHERRLDTHGQYIRQQEGRHSLRRD